MPNNCQRPELCLLSETCVPCAVCPNAKIKAENAECLLDLKLGMMEQDIETIRKIITKGGTAADVLKFLDTPNA